uniref:Fringe-like glycosyltransferase domain-containing protein n=1 Tax=Clastoptera arizonana TaxID=38151 RepID=A0A1B6DR61_9HEMI
MGNMMTLSGIILLAVLTTHVFSKALKASDIVFVVLSQSDTYHSELALSLRRDILHQASILTKDPPVVRLSHEELNHHGAWTIIPILSTLQVHDGANSTWIIFCEERTRFNLKKLLLILSKYDSTEEQWLGHRLSDKEPSIIHHFVLPDSPDFVEYPLFASGFAMSTALINSFADRAKNKTSTDFSMDAAQELAMFIRIPLVHLPSSFCLQNKPECASYPLPFQPCGELVPKDDIYFAVKTCLKFHKDRIPVVKDTWGENAKHIEYFSDYKDENIPTTVVNVPNVNTGHCSKTFTIFKLILERAKDLPNLRWLFFS